MDRTIGNKAKPTCGAFAAMTLGGLLLSTVALSSVAYAQGGTVVDFHNQTPTKTDIINTFMRNAEPSAATGGVRMRGVKTRGIRTRGIVRREDRPETTTPLDSSTAAANGAVPTQAAAPATETVTTAAGGVTENTNPGNVPTYAGTNVAGYTDGCPVSQTAIAFRIEFDLNSYNLRPDAFGVLNEIGSAMNSPQLVDCVFMVEGHTDASGSDAYNFRLSGYRAQTVINFLVGASRVSPERLVGLGKGEMELLYPSQPTAPQNRRVQIRIAAN